MLEQLGKLHSMFMLVIVEPLLRIGMLVFFTLGFKVCMFGLSGVRSRFCWFIGEFCFIEYGPVRFWWLAGSTLLDFKDPFVVVVSVTVFPRRPRPRLRPVFFVGALAMVLGVILVVALNAGTLVARFGGLTDLAGAIVFLGGAGCGGLDSFSFMFLSIAVLAGGTLAARFGGLSDLVGEIVFFGEVG
jgi:hypothetical protein